MYVWNTTVSDQCCLHCNGTVFKSDSLIDTVTMEDDCKTIETSFCRLLPSRIGMNVMTDDINVCNLILQTSIMLLLRRNLNMENVAKIIQVY